MPVVPTEPTREQQLAMERALLDNWPEVIGGDVCVNGRLLDAVYAAAVSAAPPSSAADRIALLECRDAQCRAALDAYHAALIRREHGGIAAHRAAEALEGIYGVTFDQARQAAQALAETEVKP